MDLLSFITPHIQKILEKALSNTTLSKEELITLLEIDPLSAAADILRMTGRLVSQKRFGNKAMLLSQTGIEAFPCPADCTFCNFATSSYDAEPWRISCENLKEINENLTHETGVYAHFLLFMHTFDFEYVLQTVQDTKKYLDSSTQIVINVGDIEQSQAHELYDAGATGFYHVVRLGEGKDTKIDVDQRIKSIDMFKHAGLDWYTCCEPIGIEHTNEEIVNQLLLSAEKECFQNAVMRRISVPKSNFAEKGQISLMRSAQIVAVLTLAMLNNKNLASIAIHEPDVLGLSSGANSIYAEFGINPRDLTKETHTNRGLSPQLCKNMLYDTGYENLMVANGSNIPLVARYA